MSTPEVMISTLRSVGKMTGSTVPQEAADYIEAREAQVLHLRDTFASLDDSGVDGRVVAAQVLAVLAGEDEDAAIQRAHDDIAEAEEDAFNGHDPAPWDHREALARWLFAFAMRDRGLSGPGFVWGVVAEEQREQWRAEADNLIQSGVLR